LNILSYPESKVRAQLAAFRQCHMLTLNQGRYVKRYHLVLFALVAFGVGIYMLGGQFTFGVIVARFFDAMGDLFLDRGAGDL